MTVTTTENPVAALLGEQHVEPVRGRGFAALPIAAIAVFLVIDVWKWAGGDENFDGITQGIRLGLLLVWAFAGLMLTTRRPGERLGLLVLTGTALGAAAAAADAVLLDGSTSTLVGLVEGLAVALIPAVALHVLLALPTGELVKRTHRNTVVTGYVLAVLIGIPVGLAAPPVSLWVILLESVVVALVGAGLSNARATARRAGRSASACSGSAGRSRSRPRSRWSRSRCGSSSAGPNRAARSQRPRRCSSPSRSCSRPRGECSRRSTGCSSTRCRSPG